MSKSGKILSPPRWAGKLFDWYCNPDLKEELKGDIYQQFYEEVDEKGIKKAKFNFVLNVFRFFHPKIYQKKGNRKFNSNMMFFNYFKLAKRNLVKDPLFSFINITGLTLGLTAGLLISIYLYHELSYDKFHLNAENVYRIAELATQNGEVVENSASIPIPFGPSFSDDYPDIKFVRFYRTYNKTPLVSLENSDIQFYEKKFLFTDSTFFDIFSFELIKGNPLTALDGGHSVVITESMVKKYFGDQDPIGKILKYESTLLLEVTGVVKDVPSNSHFDFDFLASYQNPPEVMKAGGVNSDGQGWFWNPCHTYVLVPENYSEEKLNANISEFTEKRIPENLRTDALNISFYSQRLADIHLHSDLYQEFGSNNNLKNVYFAAIIAFFIIIIASVNFINLSTARAIHRAKEVGVRKTLGAARSQLIGQFLIESILISLIALITSTALIYFFAPFLEYILQIKLGLGIFEEYLFYVVLIVFTILLGLLAGIYPAIIISSFKPASIFNNSHGGLKGKGSSITRKGLVVFQLSISTFLIIATLVVFNQRNFLYEKDLGFGKDNLVMISIRGTEVKNNFELFRNDLLNNPNIKNASAIGSLIGEDALVTRTYFEGMENHLNIYIVAVDVNFFETFEIELIEGQDLTKEILSEYLVESSVYLVNQSFLQLFPNKSLEELPRLVGRNRMRRDPIISIVKDFHFYPLYNEIKPLALRVMSSNVLSFAAIKIGSENISESLNSIETSWKKFANDKPLDYFFLDDRLNKMYRNEEKASRLFGYFSVLAVVIACLGMFSLSSYTAIQKTKEIGIRKVFGASVSEIIRQLSINYLKLVIIAFIIIVPITWFAMNKWLDSFAYQIDLSWSIFIVGAIVSIAITLVTVSYQSFRAAKTSPAKALRKE